MKNNYCCFSEREYKKACWLIEKKCNLNCTFCFHKQFSNTETQNNNIFYQSIINELINNNIKHVILSGGEPLLSKDLFYIINLLEKNGFDISICTNAILATSDLCKKLSRTTTVKKFTVNLSTICDKNGNIITKGKKNQPVIEGITNLLAHKFDVTANIILYKSTSKEILQNNIKQCVSWGVNNISFTIPVCNNSNQSNEYIIPELRVLEIKKLLECLENELKPHINIIFNYPYCNSDNCPANKNIFGIGYNGILSTCIVKQYQ